LEALGQPPAYRMPPATPLDLRSSCRRRRQAGFLRSYHSCALIKPAMMDTAAATTRHKGSASALHTALDGRPREHRLWLVSPMKSNMPRHHWTSSTALWPAVRRLLHCMNKGRSKVERERLFLASWTAGERGSRIYRAQRRADATRGYAARLPRLPLDGRRAVKVAFRGLRAWYRVAAARR
jgi:hypothetical protein